MRFRLLHFFNTTVAWIKEYLYEIHHLRYATSQCNHLEAALLSELDSNIAKRKLSIIKGDVKYSSS
jgi:hypothetical protein